ncbi:MAG TPA: CoA-binding protein [Thermodesulfobacteriota bacterium]|nr:CoA-binding protein [Thermodesulfobacteriota bacterium]
MASMRKDLEPFFKPRHIAIVGVTRSGFSFGGMSFLQKLQEAGFPGTLYPINPKATEIQGLRAYPNLSSLPLVPDLAMVCVAATQVPAVLKECGRIGLRHVHILTAGFKEIGTEEGRQLEDEIASIAKEARLLIIGPNCMGPYCPASGLTAWGAIPGAPGPLGIISQSGAITQRLTEYAYSLGVGTDKAVSVGNETVLGSPDFLEFMGEDEGIRVIALYIESMRNGRRFFDLAQEISKKKPVIVLKGGETEAGTRTAASHTGAMAGERMIWQAFFRQTGVIHAKSLDEWMDAIFAFACLPPPGSPGVFVIGVGGGASVVSSDTCILEGLDVPSPSTATMSKLRETVPIAGSIAGNPLDDFQACVNPAYFGAILDLVYRDPAMGMVVAERLIPRKAFHTSDRLDSVSATIEQVKQRGHRKPVVFVLDSEGGDPGLAAQGASLRAEFGKGGIPAYPSVKRAVRALTHLYHYYHRVNRIKTPRLE